MFSVLQALCLLGTVAYTFAQDNSTWPYGTYGLVEPASGCPEGTWLNGHRYFDTQDKDPNNKFSYFVYSYLAGIFSNNNIQLNFCMKVSPGNSTSPDWPSGSYCILKMNQCPDGFQQGSIYWDDEDNNNHDKTDGVLPDGEYTSNTKIEFCCRSDGLPENYISLPAERSFVLLRYGLHCQQVWNMRLDEVFVRWDDEDLLNSDSADGHHPYDDGGADDHKLYFCHYTPYGGPGFG